MDVNSFTFHLFLTQCHWLNFLLQLLLARVANLASLILDWSMLCNNNMIVSVVWSMESVWDPDFSIPQAWLIDELPPFSACWRSHVSPDLDALGLNWLRAHALDSLLGSLLGSLVVELRVSREWAKSEPRSEPRSEPKCARSNGATARPIASSRKTSWWVQLFACGVGRRKRINAFSNIQPEKPQKEPSHHHPTTFTNNQLLLPNL